jgi:hypothetical protein
MRLEGFRQIKKKTNGLIGTRTRDLPAFSIVPQPTTLPRAPSINYLGQNNFKQAMSGKAICIK